MNKVLSAIHLTVFIGSGYAPSARPGTTVNWAIKTPGLSGPA